jgi:hypothetical protein
MYRTFVYRTSLLVAGAAAVAILGAPTAAAAPATCSTVQAGSECQTPGNVQINDSTTANLQGAYPDFSLFGLGRHR